MLWINGDMCEKGKYLERYIWLELCTVSKTYVNVLDLVQPRKQRRQFVEEKGEGLPSSDSLQGNLHSLLSLIK